MKGLITKLSKLPAGSQRPGSTSFPFSNDNFVESNMQRLTAKMHIVAAVRDKSTEKSVQNGTLYCNEPHVYRRKFSVRM